ncbi:TolC family protein [Cyanobium gracile]|uniref:Outer membrane protein n=1 Tax=Cyanobium gracile (strain ATCC 27147 / PCC 6307) TaxID=292564 RepID=K9P532_CYAGP|nr:TolC family protein [Cyanobium gracile]AFY28103.1 outer membrane protein [Cyanobium gracile PCC 6307]
MSSKLGAGWGEREAMGGSGTRRPLARWILAGTVPGMVLSLVLGPGPVAGQPLPAASAGDVRRLERRWNELDRQIRALEELLPAEAAPHQGVGSARPFLPEALLGPAEDSAVPGPPQDRAPLPPLALPEAGNLRPGQLQALSLEQSLAIGFANSPGLQARREAVAASLAELQSQMGTYWPRISAYANGGTDQASSSFFSPTGTGTLFPPANPFFIPPGGRGSLNTNTNGVAGGLELRYALLDFARTPKARAALARLRGSRLDYADALRRLQLSLSESYYQLQRADQLVRIREAIVRNDLLILQDSLDLKQAGLVPRLDVLRRQAIEADGQEQLIAALAERAVARRRLAALLNLPPQLTPTASDPIRLQPRWPLDLEASLLASFRDNPELEGLLATREALLRQKDAVAAELLPKLSLFASAGAGASNANNWNVRVADGGCCGATVPTSLNTYGTDWSVGLAVSWLLFDAGTTRGQARALARRGAAVAQQYAAQRNDIRLRIEQAFLGHEASLARLVAARRGVAASLEAFRDARLRYQAGLSSELDLSNTQERLIASLVGRLEATVNVNITYAQLLRELLPMPTDPDAAVPARLQWTP